MFAIFLTVAYRACTDTVSRRGVNDTRRRQWLVSLIDYYCRCEGMCTDMAETSHPTVGVAFFGTNVSGRLSSSREYPRLIMIILLSILTV